MKNFYVTVSPKTSMVYLKETSLAVDGENIASNIIFNFSNDEFIDGVARLEYRQGTNKYFQLMNKVDDTYVLPIKNVMTKEGKMYLQLVINQPEVDEEVPIFKSKEFFVTIESSINAEGEAPDEYESWLDTANSKIAEMDNLDLDVSKVGNTATVTLTDKEGNEKTVNIYDGETGPQGETGPAGADAKINGVNTLNIVAGENITIDQEGSTLTINGEAGGGGNVDDVTVNGTSVVENKVAKVVVPTKTSDLNNDSNFQNATEVQTLIDTAVSSVYKYKGSVSTYSDLPTEDLTVGDVYNVETADSTHGIKAGDNVAWNGTVWDVLAGIVDLSGYQPLIDSSHKLSSDLVDDTNNTNMFMTSAEKTKLSGLHNINTYIIDLGIAADYSTNLQVCQNILNDFVNNIPFNVIGKFYNVYSLGTFYWNKSSSSTTITFGTFLNTTSTSNYGISYYEKYDCTVQVNINVGETIVTSISTSRQKLDLLKDKDSVLGINNNIAWTPTTGSYKPATAKYAEQMVESVAPVYSSSSTYEEGDFVSYQGKLYKCNTTISTAEAWTAAHWTETTVIDNLGAGGQTIQYDVMPTASADNLGDIVQFVGTTDSTYTNGYFYKCVSDEQSTPTYSWEKCDVQYSSYVRCASIPFPGYNQKAGEGFDEDAQWIINQYKKNNWTPAYKWGSWSLASISVGSSSSTSDYKRYDCIFVNYYNMMQYSLTINIFTHYNSDIIYPSTASSNYPFINGSSNKEIANAIDYLKKTNTSSFTPSGDYNPATKLYVDLKAATFTPLLKAKPNLMLQYLELPTDEYDIGKVAKYIGTNTNDYKFGRTYTKKSNNVETILEINDNSRFLLNYTVSKYDKLEVKFYPTAGNPDAGIYGTLNGSSSSPNIHFSGTTIWLGTGREQKGYYVVYYMNTLYTITVNDGGTTEVGDIIINGTTKDTNITFANGGNQLKLFDYGNTSFRGLFYYLKIWDKTTGTLKKNWVPDIHDGKPCLHETVGDTYVYNDIVANTTNAVQKVGTNPYWEQTYEELEPNVITNSNSTYTISNLKENYLYNLGEITSLTISDVSNIYMETNIFLESGDTAATVSLPDSVDNIGDVPTFTTSGGVNTGTLNTNSKYIISVLNNVAIWKEY